MGQLRRVTKAESARAHKARAYTRAAPGKFRKSTKIISFRQAQQRAHGGITIERQIVARRRVMSSLSAHKAMITKGRNKEIRFLADEVGRRSDAPNDIALINKYLVQTKKLGAPYGYRSLNGDDQLSFKQLFYNYPEDNIRAWLGSSESSRRARMFGRAA